MYEYKIFRIKHFDIGSEMLNKQLEGWEQCGQITIKDEDWIRAYIPMKRKLSQKEEIIVRHNKSISS